MEITREIAQKVLETVDAGLCAGKGVAVPGQMCVEAAVCFALGLPHGDNPPCVAPAVREFKITLNDSRWSSNDARARGMRRVAVAQLGSTEIDERKFANIVVVQTVRQILPIVLRRAGLTAEADECAKVETMEQARAAANAAAYAAYAANAYAANAANAAYAANAYAANAAANAAYAANAAANAAYANAANAAYANAANAAANADEILEMAAEIAVQALIACGAEGVRFLDLCNTSKAP